MALCIAAYHVWAAFPVEYQEQVFCGSIALVLCFVAGYFLFTRNGLAEKIFVALAVNNLIEELGFGDPTKFTLNEYVATVIVVCIVISNYTNPTTDVAE